MPIALPIISTAVEPPGERWTFGFGDPSILAWLCVLAYFIAAWTCLKARRATGPDRAGPVKTVWTWLCVGLVALGVNKQFDLQVLLIEVGRGLAATEGWYAQRRVVLGIFLGLLALIGVGAALFAMRKLRPPSDARTAFAAFTALAVILLLRASPWAPIRAVLTTQFFDAGATLFEVHLSELLELAGATIIIVSASRWTKATAGGNSMVPKQKPPTS